MVTTKLSTARSPRFSAMDARSVGRKSLREARMYGMVGLRGSGSRSLGSPATPATDNGRRSSLARIVSRTMEIGTHAHQLGLPRYGWYLRVPGEKERKRGEARTEAGEANAITGARDKRYALATVRTIYVNIRRGCRRRRVGTCETYGLHPGAYVTYHLEYAHTSRPRTYSWKWDQDRELPVACCLSRNYLLSFRSRIANSTIPRTRREPLRARTPVAVTNGLLVYDAGRLAELPPPLT